MEYTDYEQFLLKEWVANQESARLGEKTTVVCLQMDNGYEVIGTSACVDPKDYEFDAGVYFATKDALKKVDEIVGYVGHNARQWF